ncbi:hypothetical protein P4C99_21420 [Pontiellaceae bacterium B1224]|nr:hypothetical protein [Pontiellaceae bacterium B1224]
MKTRNKTFIALIGVSLVLGIGVFLFDIFDSSRTNDLGLTRSALRMGNNPDIEILRVKLEAVANAYLAQCESKLIEACGDIDELIIDYSLSTKVRSLGYRSSFYYFCWDIHLPYSLKTKSGDTYIIVVQLSDRIEGNKHNTDKFHVLRSFIIDDENKTVMQLEEHKSKANQGIEPIVPTPVD